MPKTKEIVEYVYRWFVAKPPENEKQRHLVAVALNPAGKWNGHFTTECYYSDGDFSVTQQKYSYYEKTRKFYQNLGFSELLLPPEDKIVPRRFVPTEASEKFPVDSWATVLPKRDWEGELEHFLEQRKDIGASQCKQTYEVSYPTTSAKIKTGEDLYWKTVETYRKDLNWKEIPYFAGSVQHFNRHPSSDVIIDGSFLRSFMITKGKKKKTISIQQIDKVNCLCGCGNKLFFQRTFIQEKEGSTPILKNEKIKAFKSSCSIANQYGKYLSKLVESGYEEVDNITFLKKDVVLPSPAEIVGASYFEISFKDGSFIKRNFTSWSSGDCETVRLHNGGCSFFNVNLKVAVPLLLALNKTSLIYSTLLPNLKGRVVKISDSGHAEDIFCLRHAGNQLEFILTREVWEKLALWAEKGILSHGEIVIETKQKDSSKIRIDKTEEDETRYLFLPPDIYCKLVFSTSDYAGYSRIYVYRWSALSEFFEKGSTFFMEKVLDLVENWKSVDEKMIESNGCSIMLTEKGLDKQLDKLKIQSGEMYLETYRGIFSILQNWRKTKVLDPDTTFPFLDPEYQAELIEEAEKRRWSKKFSLADIFELD
jgi:hypothetical protein